MLFKLNADTTRPLPAGPILSALLATMNALPCLAAPPTLYHQPFYESPIRGEPDDLLLLAGSGFSATDVVVYAAIGASSEKPAAPVRVPPNSSANLGIAEIVSFNNLPLSLTLRLPKVLRADQTYALWVHNRENEWSEPVLVNDARPLWMTPTFVYASASLASLPRYLKVVGRNLQPSTGLVTKVRLSGQQVFVLDAKPAPSERAALNHFVAQVDLPWKLPPGEYAVAVSRGDNHWIPLADQMLSVRQDSLPVPEFPISAPAFGGCHPNGYADATSCIVRAIAAARAAGGGTVIFGPGVWHISAPKFSAPDGIVVPIGVNLRGTGRETTSLVRDSVEGNILNSAAFTLLGQNLVERIFFRDAETHRLQDSHSSYLQLGSTVTHSNLPTVVDGVTDVIISENSFDRPYFAISDSGRPISRLFVVHNEFGAYRTSLELSGNQSFTGKFRVDDSVIAFNTFKPGSYLNAVDRQGASASEMGASNRVDFSDNIADGTASAYLNSLQDARGWRAGFFWNMLNNHERLLIAGNVASCTGDKIGDGEAIALDNNGNTFAVDSSAIVVGSNVDSLTIASPLIESQHGHMVSPDYYVGHWVQVSEGPGVGEVRKILSYQIDPTNRHTNFKISPNWDVVPEVGKSRIGIGMEFWQTYIVANTIDHRKPLCQKSNRSNAKAGSIIVWAQSADSAISGNRQFDTDGIVFQQLYNAHEENCVDCTRDVSYMNFVEIRGNLIDGEYDWHNGCSSSGIFGSVAAGPTRNAASPPTVSFGVSIAHNRINHADGLRGGAIAFSPTWHQGPAPYRWHLVNNALIYRNTITGLDERPARPCMRDSVLRRTGIEISGSSLVWNSVLYSNSCLDAPRPLNVEGRDTVRVCYADSVNSCECPQ